MTGTEVGAHPITSAPGDDQARERAAESCESVPYKVSATTPPDSIRFGSSW